MGAFLALLGRAVAFLLTSAGGWAASDIYNEHQTAKQLDSGASIAGSAKSAFSKHKGKWIFLSIAAVGTFLLVMFVIKPLLRRGKTEQSIL